MPAAVAKGIIISISIIAALSIAVLENPQVQSWLEEQRRKIAELLRSVGQDLDPESRRRAEAFAFEGQAATNTETPQRQATPSLNDVAKATGRSMSSDASTIRRIPIKGPFDKDDAEERRNKGNEYLAKRNQQMIELQERRKTSQPKGNALLTSTSFDALVDSEGNLRDSTSGERELPSPPVTQPVPEHVKEEMKEVERHLAQPILMSESSTSAMTGWQMGSELANPFGDEYEMDRSITPRPATPVERRAERLPSPEISIPGRFDIAQAHNADREEDEAGLTYEEQIAIAMSLSAQESVDNAATIRHRSAREDADLRRAIQASLKDLDSQQAAHSLAHANDMLKSVQQPLVDLTPSTPPPIAPRPGWETFFDSRYMTAQAQQGQVLPNAPRSETTDELYSVTPELTHARLASFDAQHNATTSKAILHPQPQTHFQAAADESAQPAQEALEASFFSAASVISPQPSSHTFGNDTPQLIDISDDAAREGMQTPKSRTLSSMGFHTDLDSDTLGSASAPVSRAQSQVRSEVSGAEILVLEDDSDIDMLSEEGDGVATPDSWSEVGSRDAESEAEHQGQHPSHVSS